MVRLLMPKWFMIVALRLGVGLNRLQLVMTTPTYQDDGVFFLVGGGLRVSDSKALNRKPNSSHRCSALGSRDTTPPSAKARAAHIAEPTDRSRPHLVGGHASLVKQVPHSAEAAHLKLLARVRHVVVGGLGVQPRRHVRLVPEPRPASAFGPGFRVAWPTAPGSGFRAPRGDLHRRLPGRRPRSEL